jgi:hypothetical protein
MKNFVLTLVALTVAVFTVQAGEKKVVTQAPAAKVVPVAAKGAACDCNGACCTTATVDVVRKASLKERRNLVVVEKVPVKVVEVKKVEVVEPVVVRRRLLGRRVAGVVDCVNCN